MKERGVFERPPRSGICWVHRHDHLGARHREMAGTKSIAIRMYQKRKNEALQTKRLPQTNERLRFLSEGEEVKLRPMISEAYPERMADLDFALHTGMRSSEQYELDLGQVDFLNRVVNIGRSKRGEPRHVPLKAVAPEAVMARHRRVAGRGRCSGAKTHGHGLAMRRRRLASPTLLGTNCGTPLPAHW